MLDSFSFNLTITGIIFLTNCHYTDIVQFYSKFPLFSSQFHVLGIAPALLWPILYLSIVLINVSPSSIFPQVEGTPERPRLCVFRSNKHLYVQVIDDSKMHTLASASTMQKSISEELDYSSSPTIVSSRIRIQDQPILEELLLE